MRRRQLGVMQRKAPMREMAMQHREPKRAGPRNARKHAFADKDAAARDAITAADKRALLVPDFVGMPETSIVQRGIGPHDPRPDPGERHPAWPRRSAGGDHRIEIAIEGELEFAL